MAFDLASTQATGQATTRSGATLTLVALVPDALPSERLVMLDRSSGHVETFSADGAYFPDAEPSEMDLI